MRRCLCAATKLCRPGEESSLEIHQINTCLQRLRSSDRKIVARTTKVLEILKTLDYPHKVHRMNFEVIDTIYQILSILCHLLDGNSLDLHFGAIFGVPINYVSALPIQQSFGCFFLPNFDLSAGRAHEFLILFKLENLFSQNRLLSFSKFRKRLEKARNGLSHGDQE